MKDYMTGQLRNVVLLGHGSSGKTSLAEAMLYASGGTNRMGTIEEGTTVADFDEEEIRRGISLNLAIVPVEWNSCLINVMDTPGYTDFVGEAKSAMRVADLAVMVVDAVAGVEVGTELLWTYLEEQGLPRMVVVNKINRENSDMVRTVAALSAAFDRTFLPLQIPIGSQAGFDGVVDLIEMKALTGLGGAAADIPPDLVEAAEEARLQIIEAAAEADDELILKYLEGEELTRDDIVQGLRSAILDQSVVPVLVTAATTGGGVRALLDVLVNYAPSPTATGGARAEGTAGEEDVEPNELAPLAVLVFKTAADPFVGKMTYLRVYGGMLSSNSTVYNGRAEAEERVGQLYVVRGKEQMPVDQLRAGAIGAVAKLGETLTGDTLCDKGHRLVLPGPTFPSPLYAVAVSPTSKADAAKLGPTLTRICEEDPTLRWRQDPGTRQTILEGMGDSHVEIALRRMENRFDVKVETATPRVPYQETITRIHSDSYRHKKQTGGAGQFAEVHMRLEPMPRGDGFEYVWDVFGGSISRSFESSIEKGVRQIMDQGVIAGYPVVDVRAVVFYGKEHPVDSKDIAFQIAGREVFKKVMMDAAAGAVLLEPIYRVKITVPEEYTGDIMGDLNTKRSRMQGMDQVGGKTIIDTFVPLAEMQRYATSLRSLTQGRGVFTMELDHYEPLPSHLTQTIVEAHQREQEEK